MFKGLFPLLVLVLNFSRQPMDQEKNFLRCGEKYFLYDNNFGEKLCKTHSDL